MRKLLIIVVLFSVAGVGFLASKYGDFLKKPTVNTVDIPKAVINGEGVSEGDEPRVAILTGNLEIPWSLVFLPDGSALLTERPGRVRLIGADGKLTSEPVAVIPGVKHIGEGGLLGIEIHPEFSKNRFVYLYYTYGEDGGSTLNRVQKYKLKGGKLEEEKIIVDSIPGASNHNGGRIKFGPDGFLYITTGDAQEPSRSQDKNSLAGKILRVGADGEIPTDNPFNNAVYSYGHRNPQGIVWDDSGQLWETEHGPSGSWPNCCQDEVNKIRKGANYGWPDSVGDSVLGGTIGPVAHSGRDSWAPSGIAHLQDTLYFTALRGAFLMQAKVDGEQLALSQKFKGEFGRLRDVVVGPDGLLYLLTSNRDGRGRVAEGDDKILIVNPKKL